MLHRHLLISILFLLISQSSLYSGNTYHYLSECINNISEKYGINTHLPRDIQSTTDSLICGEISEAGNFLKKNNNYTDLIILYTTSIRYYREECKDKSIINDILIPLYINLGASYEEIGLNNRALDIYLKALNMTRDIQNDQKAKLLNNIGVIYFRAKQCDKAKQYFKNAISINIKTNNNKELFNNYNNLAGTYSLENNFNEAIQYSLMAIQQISPEDEQELYFTTQSNLAYLYMLKKDYPMAITYISNALSNQKRLKLQKDIMQSYGILGTIYRNMGKADSAKYYFNLSRVISDSIGAISQSCKYYKTIAELNAEDKKYEQAYKLLKKSYLLSDSIYSDDNSKRISDIESLYAIERQMADNEIEAKEIEIKNTRNQKLMFIILFISILMGSIALIAIILWKSNIKEKKLLNKKAEELKDLIDLRNRELTGYTLHTIKTEGFISSLSDEMSEMISENQFSTKTVQQIRKLIYKLNTYEEVNGDHEFTYYFEKVHPSFYSNLQKSHPDLTNKEKRLCAFIRLGLSTKEIAQITYLEVRSVETARSRLRKKLNLMTNESIEEYMSRL